MENQNLFCVLGYSLASGKVPFFVSADSPPRTLKSAFALLRTRMLHVKGQTGPKFPYPRVIIIWTLLDYRSTRPSKTNTLNTFFSLPRHAKSLYVVLSVPKTLQRCWKKWYEFAGFWQNILAPTYWIDIFRPVLVCLDRSPLLVLVENVAFEVFLCLEEAKNVLGALVLLARVLRQSRNVQMMMKLGYGEFVSTYP